MLLFGHGLAFHSLKMTLHFPGNGQGVQVGSENDLSEVLFELCALNKIDNGQTLLYRIVDQHYPPLVIQLEREGRPLPDYVQREFEDYLKCGRMEHGFLRVRCESCLAEQLVAFSCKRRGFCPSCGAQRWKMLQRR